MTTSKKISNAKNDQEQSKSSIWEQIKDKDLQMFGLPGQKVCKHVTAMEIPGKLILKLKSSAVLPALEELLGTEYVVEQQEQYVVVTKTVDKLSNFDGFPDLK